MNVRFDLVNGDKLPRARFRTDLRFGAMRRSPRLSSLEDGVTLMLRRVLIVLAAAAMLLVTFTPDDAFARGGGGGSRRRFPRRRHRAGGYRGGAVAARGYRGGAVAVRGGRVAGAAIEAPTVQGPIAAIVPAPTAATAIVATVSVRPRWALLRSALLRRGPTTAAVVATTPTATGFARTGTIRTASGATPLAAYLPVFWC